LLNHYFTLLQLSKELDAECTESTVEEIFTQHKNELVITFSKNTIERSLVVNCSAKNNHIYSRGKFFRAKKNTVDVFPEIQGEQLKRCFLHKEDRIFVITLSSGKQLWCAMVGAKANVFLLDENSFVCDVFFTEDEQTGKQFLLENKHHAPSIISLAEFELQLQSYDSVSLFTVLKKTFSSLGSLLVRELCFRSRLSEEIFVRDITHEERHILYNAYMDVLNECQNPRSRIYFQNNNIKDFSIIPLNIYSSYDEKKYLTISEGIHAYISLKRIEARFLELQHSLHSSLKSKEAKISRSLLAIQKQLSENSKVKEYQYRAELLLANLSLLHRGMKEITLSDFENSGITIVIPLEEKLSPVENAERYFEKVKQTKRAFEEMGKRKSTFDMQKNAVEKILAAITEIRTVDALNDFMKTRESELKDLGISKPSEKEETRIPFRVFTVSGGYEVWAGKNSANNDELTLHHSQPNDLWFHARGGGGSHVVLRVKNKNVQIPKETILETASIAAYYSKMRKATNVPVAYCERKYVRKPKGVKEGTVYIEREKVIFVEPKLPYEEE